MCRRPCGCAVESSRDVRRGAPAIQIYDMQRSFRCPSLQAAHHDWGDTTAALSPLSPTRTPGALARRSQPRLSQPAQPTTRAAALGDSVSSTSKLCASRDQDPPLSLSRSLSLVPPSPLYQRSSAPFLPLLPVGCGPVLFVVLCHDIAPIGREHGATCHGLCYDIVC